MKQVPKTLWFTSARGPVELVVIGETSATYIVCSPQEYDSSVRDRREPLQVGFRKTDVIGGPEERA